MKKNSLSNSEEFFEATEKGDIKKVTFFLEADIDLNLKDKNGNTALHLASGEGHLKVVKLLLEKGANVDSQDESEGTPLHRASVEGHLEVIKFLLEKEQILMLTINLITQLCSRQQQRKVIWRLSNFS